jgi:hypothetical protein
MFELEKRGVPTVTWTAERFSNDANASARAFGLQGIAIAVIPIPATNQTEDNIRKMAESSINQVIDGLTKPILPKIADVVAQPSEVLSFQGEDALEAFDKMNRSFLIEGLSDGFPIVPPTAQAVERMLSGTALNRSKVVCLLEPDFGIATVEKIAINAVMAGCRPEHLPVVITAVQCLSDPRMLLRNFAMSTAPHAPLILINGPIAKKININSKSCALGPGSISFANTVIGRSIRLIMMNIGHSYPGTADMDTIGSPTKYSMCLAENEDQNPWEPFHVERGFSKDVSTVTIHFNYGLCDMADAWSTSPEGLVEKFSGTATNLGHMAIGQWLIGHREDQRYQVQVKEHDLILMCPDHAKVFANSGWSKDRVRQSIHDHALAPARLLWKDMKLVQAGRPEMLAIRDNPDAMLPVLESPDCYHIAVVGADVGRSLFCWGAGDAVTKPIESQSDLN